MATELKDNQTGIMAYIFWSWLYPVNWKTSHLSRPQPVKPAVHLPRKVPAALHPRVLKELQWMEDLRVIEKQSEPTS